MGQLIQQVDTILSQTFPGSERYLEIVPGERIGGYMAWQGFEGVAYYDRQRRVWDTLQANLPQGEPEHVSAILAFTPGERNAYREGVEDDH